MRLGLTDLSPYVMLAVRFERRSVMKRSALTAAATLTLLMTSAFVASQNYAQDVTLPPVTVTGELPDDRHPQDGNHAEDRLLGCAETVTPSTGGELSGTWQAKGRLAGIPVMPDMCNPSSVADMRPGGRCYQTIPAGWTSPTPPCR